MTQIALDAEILSMKATRINLSMELKESDMSGQTSATDGSEQGCKGKVLAVSGIIPFKEPEALSRLIFLAQQKEDGKRKIYRIGNELTKSMKIRQVRFTGRVSAEEQENIMAWKVSFRLTEYLSVPEVKEQREADKQEGATTDTTENSSEVQPTAHAAVTSSETTETTRFASAMSRSEERLA